MNKRYILGILSLLFFSCSSLPKGIEAPSDPLFSIHDAQGNITVTLSREGQFYFIQNDPLISFTVPTADPDKAMDADVRRYRSLGEEYELIVTIIRAGMKDGLPEYRSRVQYKKHDELDYRDFSGTAEYAIDHKLYNLWMVKAVDGKTVKSDDFAKEIPVIEMNSNNGNFMGSTGCNTIRGSFSTRENMIYFGHTASTGMICEKAEFSSRIAEILSQNVYEYSFEGRELVLYKRGTERIRFINVD